MWRVVLSVSTLVAGLAATPAVAQTNLVVEPYGRSIVYGSEGKVRRVVRESPSGFLIADRSGTEAAVRRTPSGLIVTDGQGRLERAYRNVVTGGVGVTAYADRDVIVLGTGLAGGVGSP